MIFYYFVLVQLLFKQSVVFQAARCSWRLVLCNGLSVQRNAWWRFLILKNLRLNTTDRGAICTVPLFIALASLPGPYRVSGPRSVSGAPVLAYSVCCSVRMLRNDVLFCGHHRLAACTGFSADGLGQILDFFNACSLVCLALFAPLRGYYHFTKSSVNPFLFLSAMGPLPVKPLLSP